MDHQRRHIHASRARPRPHDEADPKAAEQAAVKGRQHRLHPGNRDPAGQQAVEDQIEHRGKAGGKEKLPSQHRRSDQKQADRDQIDRKGLLDMKKRLQGDRNAGDAAGENVKRQNEHLYGNAQKKGSNEDQSQIFRLFQKAFFWFHCGIISQQ